MRKSSKSPVFAAECFFLVLSKMLFLATTQVAAASVTPPKVLNLDSAIRGYPIEALRQEQSGTTVMTVDVDKRGRVTGCQVIQSSGSASLDTESCRAMRRARFAPAVDGLGQATAWKGPQNIKWVLPVEKAWPLSEWTSRTALTITAGGSLRSCTKEITSPIVQREPTCDEFARSGKPLLMALRNDRTLINRFKGGDKTAVFEVSFSLGPQTQTPRAGDRAAEELVVRSVSAFKINAEGRVTDCQVVESIGQKELRPNICRDFFHGPYERPLDESGNPAQLPAHGTVAIYIRK